MLGSGKSSTGKRVANELGYKHYSSGDFMRQLAENRNTTLIELSKIAETDDSIDKEIDQYVEKAGQQDNIVIDSRLAYHWIPNSFKVFLTLPTEVGAQRMLNDLQNNPNRTHEHAERPRTVEEVVRSAETRLASERKRYNELYGIKDHIDPANFDLVIDTEKNNLDQVVDIVKKKYEEWLNN